MSRSLLEKNDLDAISQLQLFARGVVEGITGGRHRSPHKGASIEYKEHREYVRGDEIRSIDWKLFGKTDRLFIRQYEDETNLRSMILLDQSGSMGYRGSKSKLSKHEFGVRLAASLATLLVAQQDAVGLATIDTELRESIPPRSSQRHIRSIFETLVRSKPGGETSLGSALQQSTSKIKRRGVLVLISDCFDQIDRLISALRFFRHHGHDVIVLLVWDQDELNFPFHNRTEFRSLENKSKQVIDPHALRKSYLERVKTFQEELQTEATKLRVDWVSCTTADSCGDVLKELIAKRGRSRR